MFGLRSILNRTVSAGTNTTCGNSPPFDYWMTYDDGSGPIVSYFYTQANNKGILKDFTDQEVCINGPCLMPVQYTGSPYYAFSVWDFTLTVQNGQPGRVGDDAGDGTFDDTNSDPNTKASADAPSSWFMGLISQSKTTNPHAAKLFPNPAKKNIWIEFIGNSDDMASIIIYDVSGRKVASASLRVSKGDNKLNMPTELLSVGTYNLQLKTAGKTSRLSFTVIE